MVQSKDSYNISAYISNKLKMAQNKREKLLDLINSLFQVSIKNNAEIVKSGNGDIVKLIVEELKHYYKIIRTHIECGSGNSHTFNYILNYFDDEFLKENKIAGLSGRLEQQLLQKEHLVRSTHSGNAGHNGARSINTISASIGKVLTNWKNTIESNMEPMLREYLSEINDIVLYNCLMYASNRTMISVRDLMHESACFKDCKESFAFYFEMLMKLTHKYLSDDDMAEQINRMLQQMGFKNMIMKSRNISQEKYGTLITEVVKEVNTNEYIMRFTTLYRNALEKIRDVEKNDMLIKSSL